jgi:hypothetical protein
MNVVVVAENANPSGEWAPVSKVILFFTHTTRTRNQRKWSRRSATC